MYCWFCKKVSLYMTHKEFRQRQRHHAFSVSLLALAAVLYTAVPAARAEQQPPYSFKTEVNEVQLAFVATDQRNRYVATLTPADIAVVDNGTVIRRFRSLNRYPQVNLDALLLMDASESLARRFSQEIAEAAQLIAEAPWKPDDVLSILSFGGLESSFVCVRDCRALPPAAWASKIHAKGQTPLFDAVILGVEFLSKNRGPNYRPVLIILSDGADTISMHSFRDAVSAAMRAEIPIYTLNTGDSKTFTSGGDVLRDMAALTGGCSFTRATGAPSALASVVEDLRNAYVLTYELPSHAEGLHSVSILPMTNSNLRLRSRRAYYYTSTGSSPQRESR
jgi:VWFA-related protein